MSSTGVIGEDLPYQKIIDAIPKTLRQNANLNDAAKAIMTTDTYPKLASISTHIGGIPVNLVAIAKGSGMSAPNMATVLSYIFTDAKIQHNILQQLLNQTINKSLNCLTIDSDSSTNDMALFFATASSEKHKAVKSIKDSHLKDFILSLDKLMIDITKQLARDGEGASKLVIVKSKNANSKKEAKIIAKSIAESPLVKTAIFGKDPNWGRIAMAIGKTKLKVNLTKLEIKIGEFILYGKSKNQMTKKMETKVSQYLENNEEILISVDIGFDTKSANATIYSCDFTDKYISINADYRS